MSENTQRRLPIYLLLDNSSSMAGPPMQAVRQGLTQMLADLRGNPQALESAYLSVIVFDNDARQVVPLTELTAFVEPKLEANGMTALAAGLYLLQDCLDKEVRKSSPDCKGDYRPLVFLMTDGEPSDAWEEIADKIKSERRANIIACAAGPGANTTVLKRITECVVLLHALQPDTIKAFFRWVSASVGVTSKNIAQRPGGGTPVNLPNPPAGFTVVP